MDTDEHGFLNAEAQRTQRNAKKTFTGLHELTLFLKTSAARVRVSRLTNLDVILLLEYTGRMRKLRATIALGAALAFTGCHAPDSGAIFSDSIFGNASEAKGRLNEYKQILLVCVYEDHWEDQGYNKYSLHHFKATVVKSYKGDWKTSEKISFVHGADFPAPTSPHNQTGNLLFIFTNQHQPNEIGLETGDFLGYDPAIDRQISFLFPAQ